MRKIRSHSGTLALKTEGYSKRIGRFGKTPKWIYQNALLLILSRVFCPGDSFSESIFTLYWGDRFFSLNSSVLRARVPKWSPPPPQKKRIRETIRNVSKIQNKVKNSLLRSCLTSEVILKPCDVIPKGIALKDSLGTRNSNRSASLIFLPCFPKRLGT